MTSNHAHARQVGEIDIDSELVAASQKLDGKEEARIMMLNNGCLCCTVRDDLIDMLTELVGCPPPPGLTWTPNRCCVLAALDHICWQSAQAAPCCAAAPSCTAGAEVCAWRLLMLCWTLLCRQTGGRTSTAWSSRPQGWPRPHRSSR